MRFEHHTTASFHPCTKAQAEIKLPFGAREGSLCPAAPGLAGAASPQAFSTSEMRRVLPAAAQTQDPCDLPQKHKGKAAESIRQFLQVHPQTTWGCRVLGLTVVTVPRLLLGLLQRLFSWSSAEGRTEQERCPSPTLCSSTQKQCLYRKQLELHPQRGCTSQQVIHQSNGARKHLSTLHVWRGWDWSSKHS